MTLLQYSQNHFLRDLNSLEFIYPKAYDFYKMIYDKHFDCKSKILKRILNSMKVEISKK